MKIGLKKIQAAAYNGARTVKEIKNLLGFWVGIGWAIGWASPSLKSSLVLRLNNFHLKTGKKNSDQTKQNQVKNEIEFQ